MWNKVHQPEKEQADHEITQLRAVIKTRAGTADYKEMIQQLPHLLPSDMFRTSELQPEPK